MSETHPEAGVEQASPEDRILNILKAEDANQAEPEQATAAPEQDQPEAPAEDGELTASDLPDEEAAPLPATPDEFEILHNGAPVKLSRDEVTEYARKGFDYERKTQAAAETMRKAQEFVQKLELVEQVVPQLETAKAEAFALYQQVQQYENADWNALAEDFTEFPKHQARYNALVMQFQKANKKYTDMQQAVTAHLDKTKSEMLQMEMQRLPEVLPAWKNPAKQKADTEKASAFLKANGIAPEVAGRYLDNAFAMKVLVYAAHYDELLQGKAGKVKQLRTAPPVPKPGSATQGTERADRDRELRQSLKRSGSAQDAMALIAGRLK